MNLEHILNQAKSSWNLFVRQTEIDKHFASAASFIENNWKQSQMPQYVDHVWSTFWNHSDKEFYALNYSATAIWAILFLWCLFPKFGKLSKSFVQLYTIVVSVFYAAKFIAVFKDGGNELDLLSFSAVAEHFKNQQIVVLGWAHYVVFDLLFGMSVVEKVSSYRLMIRICFLPLLPLVFLLGPIGYLVSFLFLHYASKLKPYERLKKQ
jgi:hypothetical protein